jgi:two-component system LytT family response regulator
MTAASIRAVIVEDEPHARASLREYAQGVEWIDVVGEAADGREGIRIIDELRPDLVFLDITLPEVSGLDVLGRIQHKPEVVFTTAYDQYAITAFELGALDYLLKPFGRQRFQSAVERLRGRMQGRGDGGPRACEAFGTPLRRLFARHRDEIIPIDVRTIESISANGDYVEVHHAGGRHLLHATLGEISSRLDPEVFRQIHRSHIVSLDAVVKLVPFDARRLLIRLRGGREIVASRTASEALRTLVR